jgi:hypothetical protein
MRDFHWFVLQRVFFQGDHPHEIDLICPLVVCPTGRFSLRMCPPAVVILCVRLGCPHGDCPSIVAPKKLTYRLLHCNSPVFHLCSSCGSCSPEIILHILITMVINTLKSSPRAFYIKILYTGTGTALAIVPSIFSFSTFFIFNSNFFLTGLQYF